jgi:RNA polymerase sigma-70 factor (ECF subfamily)
MFPLTDWKVIFEATLAGDPAGQKALDALCTTYRGPVISFLRSKGWNAVESEDLVQQLFLKLCESRAWKKADRAKGPFRTFLLTILQRIISNRRAHENTLKKGGGVPTQSLDWLEEETGWEPSSYGPEPSAEFDHSWALNTLLAAFSQVEARWEKRGKSKEFSVYRRFLPGSQRPPDYSDVANELKIAEAAARKAVDRLRDELQKSLRQEIAATVGLDGDVEAEMRYLGEILAKPAMHCSFDKAPADSNRL